MSVACTQHDTFFISLVFISFRFSLQIYNVEVLMQSTRVQTRHVDNELHKHVYMSVTYTLNLVNMHIDVYMNCKPRMMV